VPAVVCEIHKVVGRNSIHIEPLQPALEVSFGPSSLRTVSAVQ
jgi:hypothetical protein